MQYKPQANYLRFLYFTIITCFCIQQYLLDRVLHVDQNYFLVLKFTLPNTM